MVAGREADNGSTADSIAEMRAPTSRSPPPDMAHSRVLWVRLRHRSHRLLVRAAPAKQIEYSDGFILDHCLLPVVAA